MFVMETTGNRVLVAMSGGVDSSVAAVLLRNAGYDVAGITMSLLGPEQASSEAGPCVLAQRVCESLNMHHAVCYLEDAFETYVVNPFCKSYQEGRTPNPCIDCNRHLKFAALQKERRDRAYDYVATGHYALRVFNDDSGRFELHRATDKAKDQTYFLYHLDQDTLGHMLFPLGGLTKPQVRAIATENNLASADRGESQDICFVPGGDYASFIAHHIGCSFEPGDIVDRSGKVLGRHRGLIHYTVGQRKGIGVAAPEPLYVFAKDAENNKLIVDTHANTLVNSIEAYDVNFIALPRLDAPVRLSVKTHYRQNPQPATIEQIGEDRIRIVFDKPQRACAPGQAAVAYSGENVICGGTIC